MKEFLIKISVFFASVFAFVIVVVVKANPTYVDAYYSRFTTSKQTSLILGTSRAAQGIKPYVFAEADYYKEIYNFSFTMGTSPYGEVYFNAIKEKLKKSDDGLFILEVNPLGISYGVNTNPQEDEALFREKGRKLDLMSWFNINPNMQYFLNCYDGHFSNLLFKSNQSLPLHDNGWLEVIINMDSAAVEHRKTKKIKSYRLKFSNNEISFKRLIWLERTIEYLSDYGKVVLIRVPLSEELYSLEQDYCKDFDDIVEGLANKTNCLYLDFTFLNQEMKTTDGNHLYKEYTEKFSKILTDSLTNVLE